MRKVFVGIKISEPLRNQVYDWQKAHWDLPVRFLARQNLHITLLPPWQIYEEDLPILKTKLSEFRGHLKPFTIYFDHISLGPNLLAPRLIWAIGETAPDLINLKKTVENKLSLLNGDRPLKLHLTMARFKPDQFHFRLDESIRWMETVGALALYETIWDMAGAEYVELEKILF